MGSILPTSSKQNKTKMQESYYLDVLLFTRKAHQFGKGWAENRPLFLWSRGMMLPCTRKTPACYVLVTAGPSASLSGEWRPSWKSNRAAVDISQQTYTCTIVDAREVITFLPVLSVVYRPLVSPFPPFFPHIIFHSFTCKKIKLKKIVVLHT